MHLNLDIKLILNIVINLKEVRIYLKSLLLITMILSKKTKDPVQRSIAKLFLNSLYGRLGMKDIESTLKIVDKKEAEYLDKNTNVIVLSELAENKYIIKFSGHISDNLRQLYKTDPLISEKENLIYYNRKDLRELGLNKKVSVPSAVHIAAAIASYARIIINDYKNIPGNPCIMSDTDSAILPKPLPKNLVGAELGQMKLEHKITEGIFIRKKLYTIKNSNNQVIIKASGVDSSHLNYNLFSDLLKGQSVEIERTNFNVEWNKLNINVVTSYIKLQGLQGEIKTIYNTPDSNFKYISFPIKYNLIVHPLYPITHSRIKQNVESENKIKNNNKNFVKFSTLEKFIIFIFLFSFFSLFILFLYKIY